MPGTKTSGGGVPTAIKRLRDTIQPCRLNTKEPQSRIIRSVPSCPKNLEGEARIHWRKIGRVLASMRVLTQADLDALGLYCEIYARWRDAEDKLKKTGVVIKMQGGLYGQNPYLKVANECIGQLQRYMNEFGLTPASRTRIHAEEVNLGSSDKDRFFSLN